MKSCPTCGQSLPRHRPLGLKLGPSTTRLFAMVEKAGPHGIPTDVLYDRLYANDPNGGPLTGHKCLHVRIYLLNKKLRQKGKEIAAIDLSGRNGGAATYILRDVR